MPKLFKPRPRAPIALTPAQAAEIGNELELLSRGRSFKRIPEESIVEAAKAPTSAMHSIIWARPESELINEGRCALARKLADSIWVIVRPSLLAGPQLRIVINPQPVPVQTEHKTKVVDLFENTLLTLIAQVTQARSTCLDLQAQGKQQVLLARVQRMLQNALSELETVREQREQIVRK